MTRQDLILVPVWEKDMARRVDSLTSARYGIAPVVLIELAGCAVAQTVQRRRRTQGAQTRTPVIVLAGLGNNGADALVAARWLAEGGSDTYVYIVADPGHEPSALNRAQQDILAKTGVSTSPYVAGCLDKFLESAAVVIDGVVGIGARGSLAPSAVAALEAAAATQPSLVVAIDLPSGLDCDAGQPQVVPLKADVTVTFGGPKIAHVIAPARDLCGEIEIVELAFPKAAVQEARGSEHFCTVEPGQVLGLNPWRQLAPSAHKYDRGHVLIAGGSPGKSGAPLLAALAALRCGAGWASVSLPKDSGPVAEVPPECTFEELFDGASLSATRLAAFLSSRHVRAAVIGPGCMVSPLSPQVVSVLIDFMRSGGFVALDAAAVHGAGQLLQAAGNKQTRLVLTPHPGEWERLEKSPPAPPLTPKSAELARAYASARGATLIYKSSTPVVVPANPEQPLIVVNHGTRILARAGTGDVLAGVLGAHGAIGQDAVVAAVRAQVVVAQAARLAASAVGEDAVLATDIIASLGWAQRLEGLQ